jgi:hypothetical protein
MDKRIRLQLYKNYASGSTATKLCGYDWIQRLSHHNYAVSFIASDPLQKHTVKKKALIPD